LLARSQRTGQADKDLKPNAEIRNKLNEIISYPSTQQLSGEELDHLWRFRYYLSSNKKALAKFIKCINWENKKEVPQALELLSKWSPMDPEDALELLGPNFKHPDIRSYAVSRLKQASDADLQLYLLQLVQALKYEKINAAWLREGLADNVLSLISSDEFKASSDSSMESSASSSDKEPPTELADDALHALSPNGGGLAAFLIDRSCNNPVIANFFFWYLCIECEGGASENVGLQEDKRTQEMYYLVLRKFKSTLTRGPLEWKDTDDFLDRQRKFMAKLVLLIKAVHRESGNRDKKIKRLQSLLADPEAFKFNFVHFDPLPLPLDPTVQVCGLYPEKATLFKSSLMPAKLTFKTTDGKPYVALFKHGDDLRQDQLVLQMISLMDKVLQQENLDLKLSPYSVLATSSKHGFVQFVESVPIADILTAEGTIQNYFRKCNPCDTGPYKIQAEVMDTYVKSCAGYSVITFILGVGDRHLDNLLISETGKLLHIDFGYILGRDPKVMPPPMKLSKEMIETFGGMNSDHFGEFKKECYTAYLSLRRHANLILNLFSLMVDASVPDIALEPDKIVKKIQEKFRLDISDEEAVRYIQNVIDVSAMAVIPGLVDRVHKLAQLMRN
jgi:phosphatidylinositol 3-kinase